MAAVVVQAAGVILKRARRIANAVGEQLAVRVKAHHVREAGAWGAVGAIDLANGVVTVGSVTSTLERIHRSPSLTMPSGCQVSVCSRTESTSFQVVFRMTC